jgi:hypothetical protein
MKILRPVELIVAPESHAEYMALKKYIFNVEDGNQTSHFNMHMNFGIITSRLEGELILTIDPGVPDNENYWIERDRVIKEQEQLLKKTLQEMTERHNEAESSDRSLLDRIVKRLRPE